MVGLPRFWSVLFASVVLLCMAIYYLYGWMTIVDRSSLQFRGSIVVAVVRRGNVVWCPLLLLMMMMLLMLLLLLL